MSERTTKGKTGTKGLQATVEKRSTRQPGEGRKEFHRKQRAKGPQMKNKWNEAEELMQGTTSDQMRGARMHAEIVTTGETYGRMNNWNEWDPPIRATYVQECVRLLAASETRGARDAIHQSWNDPSPEVRAAGSKWEEIINEENGEESELDLSLFAQSEAYGEHWRGLVRLAEARQRVPWGVIWAIGEALEDIARSKAIAGDATAVERIVRKYMEQRGHTGRAARKIAKKMGIAEFGEEETEAQKTRIQHYVPQFMQKRWRGCNEKVVKINMRTGKVDRCGIKKNWQEEFFYESEKYPDAPGVEQILSRIEHIWAKLSRGIYEGVQGKQGPWLPLPGTNDWEWLLLCAALQFARTDQTAEQLKSMHEQIIRFAAETMEAAGAFDSIPERLQIKDTIITVDPAYARRTAVGLSYSIAEAIQDLKAVLVNSPRGRIGLPDVGAWRDNLYDGGRTSWGMGSIGTVLAVPISPHWMVVLMDASVYEWEGERGWPPIYKMRRRDEDRLALETMYHCRGEVVFLEKDRKWMERCLSRAYAEHKLGVRTRRIPGLKTHPELEEIAREMASQRGILGIPQRSEARTSRDGEGQSHEPQRTSSRPSKRGA